MKNKNFYLIFFILIFFISKTVYPFEFDSLFGLKLHVDSEKYFERSFIQSNKFGNKETHYGFYDLEVTEKIIEKNPFLSNYWVVLDSNNFIKQISAEEEIIDLNKCTKFKEQLIKIFISKYTFNFNKREYTHKDFYTHSDFAMAGENNFLSVKCVENFSPKKVNLIISFETKLYRNRKKEFYESGF